MAKRKVKKEEQHGKKIKKEPKVEEVKVEEVKVEEGQLEELMNDWYVLDSSLVYKEFLFEGKATPSKQIAAFDLDGTLIRTRSGYPYPTNKNDWAQLNPQVFNKLRKIHEEGYRIVIFSNQKGVGKKVTGKKGTSLMEKMDIISEKLKFPFVVFMAILDDKFRKPSTGMWDYFIKMINEGVEVDKKECFYVGDMAGRPKDKDDSDRKFAEEVGIKFLTPEEVLGESTAKPIVEKREGENFNQDLCDILLQISDAYLNSDRMKAKAYKNAAETLTNYAKKVTTKKEAMTLRGIGKSIGEKVQEFEDTGKIAILDELLDSDGKNAERADKEANEKEKGIAFKFLD